MDMQRVFKIGPVFRAEIKSYISARHITEVDYFLTSSISIFADRRCYENLLLTSNLLQFTVLDIVMVIQDDYYEVVEIIESMLVYIFRGLQERKQYRYLIEVVERLYPSAKQFHIGLDEHGKLLRITFIEAKRILREELSFEADDEKNFTYASIILIFYPSVPVLIIYLFIQRPRRSYSRPAFLRVYSPQVDGHIHHRPISSINAPVQFAGEP